MLRYLAPLLMFLCGVAILLSSLAGEGGYNALRMGQGALERQARENEEMAEYVGELEREVVGLQRSNRALEQAARDRLGMAREGEVIFIFEEELDDEEE